MKNKILVYILISLTMVFCYQYGNAVVKNLNPSGVSTLAALTDVSVSSVADGEILTYASGTGLWGGSVASSGDMMKADFADSLANHIYWLDVRDFGAIADDNTDDRAAIQAAIDSLPAKGGTIFLPKGLYRVDSGSLILPVNKLTTNYISNVTIQGESSGLAAGGSSTVYGTRIDYRGTGMLFDLYDADSTYVSVNVQFKDFEACDRNGSGTTYGIKASAFTSGCLIENVGFRSFYQSVAIETYAYYSKLDRVVSVGARNIGIKITNPNMTNIYRCQASNGTGDGLYITGNHGVYVDGGWYESNTGYGIHVEGTNLHGVAITNNYLEHNTLGGIYINGVVGNYADGGYIAGNYQPNDTGYGSSIILGYVTNYMITGNTVRTYGTADSSCVRSDFCTNTTFTGNNYSSGSTTALSIPSDGNNTVIEPSIAASFNTLLPKPAVDDSIAAYLARTELDSTNIKNASLSVGDIANGSNGFSLKTGDTAIVTTGTVATGTWASNITLGANETINLGTPSALTVGQYTASKTATFTAGITTAVGDILYLHPNGKLYGADADSVYSTKNLLALALAVATADNPCLVMLDGFIRSNYSFADSISGPVYISSTAKGATVITPGTGKFLRVIGESISDSTLHFSPDKIWGQVQ